MSVSSLPEWKQLLLERKRREEEERDRREKEEEQKFASMPAWKRGIIQRRKAKQESLGDRERDVCLLQVDVRSPSDGLSDTDSSVTVNLGSEPSLSPDPGFWLDAEPKLMSQVSVETIVPVHENPFIRTQSVWRKGRDVDIDNDSEVKDKEQDKLSPKGQDGEPVRGCDIELKIERFRDLSEGREKNRSRERSQGREHSRERYEKNKSLCKESVKEAATVQELCKARKDTEERDIQQQPAMYPPHGPCLRTIRADNIIIIEQDRTGGDDRRAKWREAERERERTEEEQGKRGMKMDLREILAGGGSVTEIRASEVLIIKPSVSPEDMSAGGRGREEGEMKCSADVRKESAGREMRTNMSWLKEKEKERPWGQATVINKDDRKDSLEDNVFVERGGRVSQLLSRFGQHPKPPSRSKSSDNVLQAGKCKYLGGQDEEEYEEMKADGKNALFKGVPKRSFSFSDRVISGRENGVGDEGFYEKKSRERTHSDRSVTPWVDVASLKTETTAKIKLGCARLLDKDRFGKHRDAKSENEKRRSEADSSFLQRNEAKKVDAVDKRAAEKVVDADGDKGFTVASVKNTEGISFARRVPIRQDGRTRAEREAKHLQGEKIIERRQSMEKTEAEHCNAAEGGSESSVLTECSYASTTPTESVNACSIAEGDCNHDSTFTESSNLLSTVTDRAPQKKADWGVSGSRGAYLAHCVLSQHTEELISKIEKIGETTVYNNERVFKPTQEKSQPEGQTGSQSSCENLAHDVTPRSPKKMASVGMSAGPLEIQIPRTVFYVADEMLDRKKTSEGQDWEGGQAVERRDSWRIGKPLSRIESLREKIRQRELEKLRQKDAEVGEGSKAVADINKTQVDMDRYEERGSERDGEWEASPGPPETEKDAASLTSMAAFDVTQDMEVGMLKTCPQLPVSASQTQAARVEEAASKTATSEVIADDFHASDDEADPLKHVEEQLRRHRGRHRTIADEKEEEAKRLIKDEEVVEYASPLDQTQTLSPSPPHPNSLAAMSRIYNLETVGSKSALCLKDRAVDISSSVQLVKVKPLVSSSQQGDSPFISDNVCGVQSIQRQLEQFQLKEQEALKSCMSTNKETKGQQSSRGLSKQQVKDDAKSQERDLEAPQLNCKVSPQHACVPTSHPKQTTTTCQSVLRSQSPDKTPKATDCAPTPAPSPSSPSPAHSPSVSRSSTPSPTLFSIKSASGAPVKRGTTITISPKKPAAAAGGVMGSAARSVTAGQNSAKTPSQHTQTTQTTATEPGKKRYPTAEEIEVIGGYQNLDKSCLVKKGGTPKRGKVCFDEDQLEQVCEYPSETFMLAFSPHPHEVLRMERLQGDEAPDNEAEAEGGTIVFKSPKSMGITTTPRLRVGQCHPLLKRHKV